LLTWLNEWLKNRVQRVLINGEVSEWMLVTSGVPQGSVLGPILFIVYINDLDENIVSKLLKFADDTKLARSIKKCEDRNRLREDLEKLFKWTEDWQMNFNLDKCKVMHVGNKNNENSYVIDRHILESVEEEKDPGIVLNNKFKVGTHCAKVAKKANQVLGLIYRTFSNKNKNIVIKLNKSLVRPHLDYCFQVWRPHLQRDVDLLERVQKRATRMISECKELSYKERLRKVGLTTLETRRIRADLLEVYKIVNRLEGIDEKDFFLRKNVATRRTYSSRINSCAFLKKRFKLDMGKYSFCNRVINGWNKLPEIIVQATSINAFNGKLDRYLKHNRGLKLAVSLYSQCAVSRVKEGE
jgi:ribonuclease P/MRP protein subunit RPP40